MSRLESCRVRTPLSVAVMPRSLHLYAAELLAQPNRLWPQPPKVQAPKATPFLKPLTGIKAVLWNLYGTLLTIADGQLFVLHPQMMRMEVALDKTIQEFRMWQSMSRKPGAPWEYLYKQYRSLVEDAQLRASPRKGEAPEVDVVDVWTTLVERLQQKEYVWDESDLGDLAAYAGKIAFFFHASLQGVGAMPGAGEILVALRDAGLPAGLVGDGQIFSTTQLTLALQKQAPPTVSATLFAADLTGLSYQVGTRTPSQYLFGPVLESLKQRDIARGETLYIGSRLKEQLGPAKALGLRTALFAGDKSSIDASSADLQNPNYRPDRLLTELPQLRQILGI